jgi:SAM-dependent methyltransferase
MVQAISSDPDSWRRFWLEAKDRSPVNRRERRDAGEEVESWTNRASSYAEHSESEGSRVRREEILSWLEESEVLRPGSKVLDIGAGPGNFAIPMAARAAEVTAVEPARGMVEILEQGVESEEIGNIRIVPKTWEAVDLQAEGWTGAFDLVFASMSPGVSTPEMLEKMIAASRSHCYLSGWSGNRWGKWGLAQAELWPVIFEEDLGSYPSDILYPFGLLYALGYRPELRFTQPRVHLEMAAEEAVRELADHFSRYVQVDAGVEETIASYVRKNSSAGTFLQEYSTCQGFMIWSVAAGRFGPGSIP